MTTAVAAGASVDDAAEHADLALLRGPDRLAMVQAALIQSGQYDPDRDAGLEVAVDKIHHRPGSGVSVSYRIAYERDGAPVRDFLVASTAPQADTAESGNGVAILDDGQRTVRMWRRPFDPVLTSLRLASDPVIVRRWLREAAVPVAADQPMQVRYLTYRPTRRAVLSASDGTTTVFVKVLPVRRCEQLARRHRILADAGVSAPRLLSAPAPGVCLLSEVAGQPMSRAIAAAAERPDQLPRPADLVDWLDALPDELMDIGARPTWTDRLDFHTATAAAALPDSARDAVELGRFLEDELAAHQDQQQVPTHGDFYEGNVFTAGGRITGVIDLDSLGPGRRGDDLATMLGHVAVLPALAPTVYAGSGPTLAALTEDFESRIGPRELRLRTAAVILTLVAGTSTDQSVARLRLARQWAESAGPAPRHRANVRALSSASRPGLIGTGKHTARTPAHDEGNDHGQP